MGENSRLYSKWAKHGIWDITYPSYCSKTEANMRDKTSIGFKIERKNDYIDKTTETDDRYTGTFNRTLWITGKNFRKRLNAPEGARPHRTANPSKAIGTFAAAVCLPPSRMRKRGGIPEETRLS